MTKRITNIGYKYKITVHGKSDTTARATKAMYIFVQHTNNKVIIEDFRY